MIAENEKSNNLDKMMTYGLGSHYGSKTYKILYISKKLALLMGIAKQIHKHIMKNDEVHYLCNQACVAIKTQTDFRGKKVTCKNCLREMRKCE